MKELYKNAKIEIVEFANIEIITTSVVPSDPFDGEGDPI